MSSQAPRPAPQEEWVPRRREHGGLRQVRRTKDQKWVFKGQEKDEEVKLVVRKHPWFLLRPALPAAGVLMLFFVVSALFIRLPAFAPVWGLLDIVLGLCFLFALGYFLWRDFLNWWVNIDIITNKRIIACRGFLEPERKVIPLDKVMQVSTVQESLLSVLLKYGNVYIYLTGGRHILEHVPKPVEIRDVVNGVHQEFKATKPVEKLPTLDDPEMQALIARLGKKEKEPKLPNADERYAQGNSLERTHRPLRRFGGPLRIPAEVTYAPDEQTVMYIQRSKWLLVARLIVPALLLLTTLVLTFILPSFALLTILAALVLLVIIGLIIVNYVDDVFILTNRRIIDIERKFIFLVEVRVEAEYKNIRDIKTRISNLLMNLLDVGNIYIETPGSNPDINMTLVDHPYFIVDKINQIKDFKDRVARIKSKNERQDELVKWFTSVASVLEKKMVSRGVPNLQTMDLWTAASMAAEMGMKVVPIGEDDSYPNIEPGRIVSQDPLPGTLMAVGANSSDDKPEIHVVLSKRS
ncbi:MAG TPA: PH domain-containing protein [Ktedonobacteraceae bacterium]|nr:PH domain-containing protein [Ktedonobacteraceae bacterium]